MKGEAKYTISVVASAVLAVSFVAMFNAFMDPYGTYHLIEIPGINISKPTEVLNKSKSKVRSVVKLKPETLILGTSRTELGLDPNHKALAEVYQPVYNMALPTSNIKQHLRILKFVHGKHPLKRVILGLDFSMFNASRFDDNKLNTRLDHILDEQTSFSGLAHFNNLLTYEASSDSLSMLMRQRVSEVRPGKRTNENGLRNPSAWLSVFETVGHQGMFSRTEQKFFRRGVYRSDSSNYFSADYLQSGSRDGGVSNSSVTKINSLTVFSDLLNYCGENQIELKLFISPLHVRHQHIIVAENRWEDFESWKRGMVEAVHKVNGEYDLGYELWDFSSHTHVTTESVPADSKAEMRWYWESEHYKTELGSRIIDIMFGRSAADVDGEEFGAVLSNDGIDQYFDGVRREQADYMDQHPKDMGRLKRLKKLVVGG